MENVQYITDQQGSQIGVILALADYQRLISALPADAELLPGLSHVELKALAESRLVPAEQERLDLLLARNNESTITETEANELDQLLQQIDQLNLLKTRARYTLHQLIASI